MDTVTSWETFAGTPFPQLSVPLRVGYKQSSNKIRVWLCWNWASKSLLVTTEPDTNMKFNSIFALNLSLDTSIWFQETEFTAEELLNTDIYFSTMDIGVGFKRDITTPDGVSTVVIHPNTFADFMVAFFEAEEGRFYNPSSSGNFWKFYLL